MKFKYDMNEQEKNFLELDLQRITKWETPRRYEVDRIIVLRDWTKSKSATHNWKAIRRKPRRIVSARRL